MSRAPLSTAVLHPVKRGDSPLERVLDYWNDPVWTKDQQAWVTNMIDFADNAQPIHDSAHSQRFTNTSDHNYTTRTRLLWKQTLHPISTNTEQVAVPKPTHSTPQTMLPESPKPASVYTYSIFSVQGENPEAKEPMGSQDHRPPVSAAQGQLKSNHHLERPTCTICGEQRSAKYEHSCLQNLVKAGLITSSPALDLKMSHSREPLKSVHENGSKGNEAITPRDTSHTTETDIITEFTDMEWQLCEIPSELHQTQGELPQPIQIIMDEFWQESLAIQASARSLQEQYSKQRIREAELQASASIPFGQAESAHQGALGSLAPISSPTSSDIPKTPVESPTTNETKHKRLSNHAKPLISCFKSKFWKGKQPLRPGVANVDDFKECASCFDEIPSTSSICLSCQHSYCKTCFAQLVTAAMQTESFWPPRCCMIDIPRSTILINLSNKQVIEFGAKEKEYGMPANQRWYCTNSSCLKFFEATRHGDWTGCTHCKFQMCWHCRGKRHQGKDWRCQQDKDLQATVAKAELEGWRACYKCGQMIELNTGCHHITCKCGGQFCYLCGAPWKTCPCTPDDHGRRLQRLAAARAERKREEMATQAAAEAAAERQRRYRNISEQQLLAEKRELEETEANRLAGIKTYYDEMRKHLQSVHESQSKAVNTRHTSTLFTIERELRDAEYSQRKHEETHPSSHLPKHRDKIRHDYEREYVADFKRHNGEQSFWIEHFGGPGKDADHSQRVQRFREILDRQQKERETRAASFAKGMEVAEKHMRSDLYNDEFWTSYNKGLENVNRKVAQAIDKIDTVKQKFALEDKWVEFAATERLSLLEEDAVRFTKSGADAPGQPVGPSDSIKSDTAFLTRNEILALFTSASESGPRMRSSNTAQRAESSAMGASINQRSPRISAWEAENRGMLRNRLHFENGSDRSWDRPPTEDKELLDLLCCIAGCFLVLILGGVFCLA